MKKVLVGVTALSFALLACGDDSSSGSNGSHVSAGSKNVDLLMVSKCLDNGLGGLAKRADSGELDKAYLTQDEDGNYQILVPELSDYCGIDAQFKSKRSGDTLEIWFNLEEAAVTSCMCAKDHLFNIKADDADAKYFKYSGDVFKVTSEAAPVRPEIEEPTIPDAPEFDESEPHQHTTDVIGKCRSGSVDDESLLSYKYIDVAGWDDFSETTENGSIPLALKYEDEGDAVLVMETSFSCDEYVSSVNVFVSNDTLFVNPKISKDESVKLPPGEGCGCYTTAAFKLENEGVYADAKYMVFGNHMEFVYTLKPGTEK